MTGTVTAYQRYAGTRWRVMSPNGGCRTRASAQLRVGGERVQIVWPISAVPILSFPERVSSRGWFSSERSRG
jgi:hypothetical protein